MSAGPGIIMRSIETAVMADPFRAFTVEDLCTQAYPRAEGIEKKHRVSVLRAMRNVVRQKEGWAITWCRQVGSPCRHQLALLCTANLESAVANLRDRRIHLLGDWDNFYLIRDQIDPHWRGNLDG